MGVSDAPLDQSRPFGTVHGDDVFQRRFEQDGRFFNADGTPWTPPVDTAASDGSGARFVEQPEQQPDVAPAAPQPERQPPPNQARGTSPKDWATIEAQYRYGRLSVRQIAAKAGLSEAAVRKRARTRGWTRDAAAKG
jgi:hypothetical protein